MGPILSITIRFLHPLSRYSAQDRTMAPVIRIPAEDTLKTFQNVLKKRIDAKRILKEREKKMLSAEEYQMMEVEYNNKPFLQPVDTDNTKASIYYVRQKFIRCACKI